MTDFKTSFKTVKKLAADFKANERIYLSPKYSEAEVRKDYIDKFFAALGWDVNHNIQKNPYEQEVKVEKTQSNQKRTDYTFFLLPNYKDPKFFVEAKKPQRNLHNADDYFQTIRYGWNANTPIAVLTDFEEFHILDCRFKPNINSVLQNKNHKQFHYSDYADLEKFKEIYYLFSREAIAENSLEKYADSLPKPKGKAVRKGLPRIGYQTIDEDFLGYIDDTRETLAKAFKKNDTSLTSEELTEATQRTIDRLVFIRFLEDKLIEPDNYVTEFGNGENSWNDFIAASRKLDSKYNGIVFKKHFIDEKNFKGPEENEFDQICKDISHLNSPYDFNAIPIHILGSIYERFLGKVVHATDKRVKVEEKPEVRKAGGVYYTPKYIVDYIVQNTVGKLINNKTPNEISEMHFADIACGSGSFLISVFECLLEYHNNYYQGNRKQAKKDGCLEKDGAMILSIKQKQKILLNNIYGVDIDQQATEVTQLSLALKMLEDETTATANDMQVLFHEKILPNLSKNIVCGNSLIGTDILSNNMFESDEERKLNPMDFKNVFSEIMSSGGFDAIVGNPPYVKEYTDKSAFEYVKVSKLKKYYQGKMDLWYFFACYGLDILKENGLLGFIVINNWITNSGASILRNKIIEESQIIKIIDFGDYKVFENASIQTMIIILKNDKNINNYFFDFRKISNSKLRDSISNSLLNKHTDENILYLQPQINKEAYTNKFLTFESEGKNFILNKIKSNGNFYLQYNEATNGIHPHHPYVGKSMLKILGNKYSIGTGIFALRINDLEELKLTKSEKTIIKPYYSNSELLDKYFIDIKNKEWIIYTTSDFKNPEMIKPYPNIKNHLDKFSKVITSDNRPYGLHRSREEKFFIGKKIVSLRKCTKPTFLYSEINNYFSAAFYIIKTNRINLKFLTALLNSRLIKFWLRHNGKMQGNIYQVDKEPLLQIPLIIADKKMENKFIQLVNQMLESKKQLHSARTDKDKSYYERKCTRLDKQIDSEVYKLYDLTEEEIKIVEGKE